MILRLYFSAAWHGRSSVCPWALCSADGSVQQSGVSLLADMPKADDYVAIIASDKLSCIRLTMPKKGRRRWEAALPYMVEEFTLSEPEDNHVVPAAAQSDGQRSVFVLEKRWLELILAACVEAGITLRRAVPEMLLPNLPDSTWVLVWDGEQGFLRHSLYGGMALDAASDMQMPLAVQLSLNSLPAPKQIQLRYLSPSQNSLPQWANLPCQLNLGEPWDWRTAPIAPDTLNLLWGNFAPKAKFQQWLPHLRPLAIILALVLVVETTGTLIEWALLSKQQTALKQQMTRTFRQAFGENSVIVDPALQMRRKLTELRHQVGVVDEADYLPLLDRAAGALNALPLGSVNGLRYIGDKLEVDLRLPQKVELDNLLIKLNNKGFLVSVSQLDASANQVSAHLILQVGGGK